MARLTSPPWLSAFALRCLLAAAAWTVLTEGSSEGIALAVPLVLATALASLRLRPPGGSRLHPVAALRALSWFAAKSVVAGADVALRALRPRMGLQPAFVTLHTRLPDGPARVLLANALTLLPGTLCVALHEDRLELHVLDTRLPVEAQLREMETRIAAAWGGP